MTPEQLAKVLEDFLAAAQNAVIIEENDVLFDLAQSKFSISGEHNKCLLHVWSAERNVVRRVIEAEVRNETLRLAVQRLGQSKPSRLEICRERDRRTPTAQKLARLAYQHVLQRALQRHFPAFTADPLKTTMDLEHSFSPVYSRGTIRQGQSAFAIMGVNAQETQSSIDAALTFAILWLDACRQNSSGKFVVEGLKLFLPPGASALTRERMARLNPQAAKWQLYELQEQDGSITELDATDCGNIATRLIHAVDEAATHERFAAPIAQMRALMSEVEVAVLSPAEVAFRLHGLEFARARIAHESESLRVTTEIVFGLGAHETILSAANLDRFTHLARSIGEVRHPEGPHDHPLFRMQPERWLESLVIQDVSAINQTLDPKCFYSQLPAFSASDRAMIDVLAITRTGRLAVVELKADEDIHLPLQGLDYWARVQWHHGRGEFQRFGYFPSKELNPAEPLLYLVAPALHIHPSADTLLRYFSPQIQWELLAIDERWRQGIKVVFRKRPARAVPSRNAA